MTADDSVKTVLLTEAFGDIRSELEADTTLAGTSARLDLWVSPEHLHHQAALTWLALVVSVELPDVVEGDGIIGEQTTVENKVLVADQGGERQSRERLGEDLEDALVILGLALSLEAVHSVHIVGLVVTSVQEEGRWE